MSRTNIEIDDVLIAECMSRFDLPTKRSAVEFALRRLVATAPGAASIAETAGMGWDGLDEEDEDLAW
ncbi:MAG: type II toxin-antitoxin system VapB family antitoxin [Actinomycetota bacterium]|nr:type II toxin-antitoxin system VapB family antitoxin [Actinomycetota bacterium]